MKSNKLTPNLCFSAKPTAYEVEFAACETQRCVNVAITEDLMTEPERKFQLSLSKISLFLTLSTVTGEVAIVNNNGLCLCVCVCVRVRESLSIYR